LRQYTVADLNISHKDGASLLRSRLSVSPSRAPVFSSPKYLQAPATQAKNEKSKDYCKADFKQRVLFFITIFRLAIPAFFRFTDVTVTICPTIVVFGKQAFQMLFFQNIPTNPMI